jgi:hypothetical protein
MDSDKLVVESDLKKGSFLEHLFNFDDDSKGEMLNILQYIIIAIIPVILLNKGVAKLIPKVDEDNSSFVIGAEILGQASLIFLGMLLIHRFVTYFPTYSKRGYAPLHVTNVIIVFLVIVASFQTRIGEKTNILIDRIFDLIEGKSSLGDDKSKDTDKNKQKQGGQVTQHTSPHHQPSRADVNHAGTTHISQLHNGEAGSGGQDFNAMFAGPNNPMVNAQTPGMGKEAFTEPMAANAFGGSFNAF